MIALRWVRPIPLLVAVALVAYPLIVPRFWILSIGAQSLILGIVALSLVFLAGYGGMVSLAQAALAGLGAYGVAILTVRVGLPMVPSTIVALAVATLVGLGIGAISVRSQGIYFLMLTLALAVGFFYLVLQNYEVFNGHRGIAGIPSPTGPPRSSPAAFYYLCLATAAALSCAVRYIARAPFGLALQGIRDNPRRMRALGYSVDRHRIAAFGIAGFIAGAAGILGLWYRGSISPGTVDLIRTIDVLIVAVVGGLAFPLGAFLGALLFVLAQTFASSLVLFDVSFDERFNTLIGLVFLVVVLFSPDGLVGIGRRLGGLARRLPWARRPRGAAASSASPHPAPSIPPAAEPGDRFDLLEQVRRETIED